MASLADIMSQQLAQQLADADRHAAESAERERSAALAAEQAAIASATASVEAGAADAAEAAGEADSLAEDADTRLARALQAAYDAETGHWPAEVPGSSVPAGTGSSTGERPRGTGWLRFSDATHGFCPLANSSRRMRAGAGSALRGLRQRRVMRSTERLLGFRGSAARLGRPAATARTSSEFSVEFRLVSPVVSAVPVRPRCSQKTRIWRWPCTCRS